MESENINLQGALNINIVIREENMDEGQVIIVNNEELGISDFGDNLNGALENFKKSARMYLETYPDKIKLLKQDKPLLVSRISL